MAGLNSWLSPNVMHALGWALIHSLWQCLAGAALAAVLMALFRRPSIRYLIGVGALAAMLAAPVATFFVLMAAPAAPVMASNAPVEQQPIVKSPAAGPVTSGVNSGSASNAPWSVMLVREEKRFPSMNLLPWVVAAWLCGVTFFSLRLAGGFLLLEHKRRSQSTSLSNGILTLCQDVQRQLGLDRAIEYLECAWLQTPAVIGWLRPAVLLPITAVTGLSEAQLRAVIAHELAHIRRFDLLVNLFQVVVETLLFYHPAVWWLSKRIRAERELCCDEIAVAASGNRLEYARALTLMAEWQSAPRLAMAINRGPLSERIFHILGRKSASAGQRMLGLTGSILFLVAALAAANALFVVAAPPIAQAKESVKAALSASQATVAHLAQQVLQTGEPAKPSVAAHADTAVPEPAQASNDVPHQDLAPLSADLSKLPAPLTTPTVLASSSSPATTRTDQPAAPAPVAASAGYAASKTQAAMMCLVGLGKDGCEAVFVGGSFNDSLPPITRESARRLIWDCWFSRCLDLGLDTGPLEKVEYLGANKAGDDVYVATFMHRGWTYAIAQPTPEGSIPAVRKFLSPPSGVVSRRSLIELQPPALPARTIYSAEQSATSLSAAPAVTAESGARPKLTSNERPVVIASAAATANASGPKTEAGIRCLLGLEPDGCWRQFEIHPAMSGFWTPWVGGGLATTIDCTSENWDVRCPFGPLERIEYLGTNATGEDIYSVSLMHRNMTYVLRPPAPNGKIERYCANDSTRTRCSGDRDTPRSSMTVASPASPVQILYSRPTEGSGQKSDQASARPSSAETVPNTPSGAGDPNATVCRTPQPIPGSDKFGPQLCLHNEEWWKMAMNGKDVAPDGTTLIDRPTVDNPKGEGDPDAITCRTRKVVSHWTDRVTQYGPLVCRLNSFWADVIKSHQMVDARGNVVPRGWNTDYGPAYGPGGYPYNGDPGQDSGRSPQSSNGGGNTPTMPGYTP